MDEIIRLEEQIGSALIEGAIPDDLIPAAHDILCNSWNGPGTRLEKLRSIGAAIKQVYEPAYP